MKNEVREQVRKVKEKLKTEVKEEVLEALGGSSGGSTNKETEELWRLLDKTDPAKKKVAFKGFSDSLGTHSLD